MSIASLADGAIQRKRATAGASTAIAARQPGSEGRTITPLKGATELARYVPTEAIALYIAILSGAFAKLTPVAPKKISDLDFTGRWIFYGVMLVVTVGLVWLIYAAKTRANDRRRRDVPVFEMFIAALAMAAWAAALPDSPFEDFTWYGGWFAATVLATSIALIPLVATACGRTAPTYDDQTPAQEA